VSDGHRPDGEDRPHQEPVPPFGTLAALAAQVADIRGKVTYLDAIIDRAGLLAAGDIRNRVARLTADLDRLASQVDAQGATLAEALKAGPTAKAPTWVGLDQADHGTQLAELTEWVDGVLRPSYPGSAPGPCWPSHWQAIWELSTLAAEWRRVYQRKARSWPARWTSTTAGCPASPAAWPPSRPAARQTSAWQKTQHASG
jgi:hypothetical protein